MIKAIILVLLLITFTSPFGDSAFCSGFKAGWKQGKCNGEMYCYPGYPPFCPYPNFGEDTYTKGYNRGFLLGLSQQN